MFSFGRRRSSEDGVAIARKQLEQQNVGLVKLAHLFAGMLVIATSIASLISLAGDILQAVIEEIREHPDQLRVPILASIVITFLLVLAMDTGMLLAAGQIRVKLARRAPFGAMAFDVVILVSVAILEAATYCYMLFLYEDPANQVTGALIIARAIAVPVLSICLVMARPVAVTPGDILALASLAAGTGFLKDVAAIASNTQLPTRATRRMLRMFKASAKLDAKQSAALEAMIRAAEDGDDEGDDPLLDEPEGIEATTPKPPRRSIFAGLSDRLRRRPRSETEEETDDDIAPPRLRAPPTMPAVLARRCVAMGVSLNRMGGAK